MFVLAPQRVEIRGVISQQAATGELLLFPDRQKTGLRLTEFVLFAPVGATAIKAVPDLWRGEAVGLKPPQRMQLRVAIPIGHFGFRAGLADAVDGLFLAMMNAI